MQLDVLGSSAKALAAVRLRILAVAAYGEHLSKGPKPVASAEVLQLRRVTACLLASVLDSGPAGPHSMSLHGLEARLHLACANAWQVVCSAHASTSIWQEIADGSILKLQQGGGLLGQELSLPTGCIILDPGALEVRAIQVAVQAAPDEPSHNDHAIGNSNSNSAGAQTAHRGQHLSSGNPDTPTNQGQQHQCVASPPPPPQPPPQQQGTDDLQAAVNAVYSSSDPLVRARRVLAAALATRTSGPLGPASAPSSAVGQILSVSVPDAWALLTAKAKEAGISRTLALLRPSDGVLLTQYTYGAYAGAVLLDVRELRRRAALITTGAGDPALAYISTAGVSGSQSALSSLVATTPQPASPASHASRSGQVGAKAPLSPPAAQTAFASQVQQPTGQYTSQLVQQTPRLSPSGPVQPAPSPPAVVVQQEQQQGAEVGADLEPTALALAAAVFAATWPHELVMTLAGLSMVTAPASVVAKNGGRHRCFRGWLEAEVMRVCREPIVEAMLAPEQLATNIDQARSLIKRHSSVIEDVPGGVLAQLKLSTLSEAITRAAERGVLPDLAILPLTALHQRASPYLKLLQQLQSEQERVGEGGATGWGNGQSTLRRLLQQSALYVNGLVQSSSAVATPSGNTDKTSSTSSLSARSSVPHVQVVSSTTTNSQHIASSPAGSPAVSEGMQAAPPSLRELVARMYPGNNDLSKVKQVLALELLEGADGPLGKHSIAGPQLGSLMPSLLPLEWASVKSKHSKLAGMPSDGVLVAAKPASCGGNIAVLLDIEQLKQQAPHIVREAERVSILELHASLALQGRQQERQQQSSQARPHSEAVTDELSPELAQLSPLICRTYSGADELSQVKRGLALELLRASGIGPLGPHSIAGPQLGALMHRLLPTQWASVRSKHSKIFDIFQPSDGVLVAEYTSKNVAVMLDVAQLKQVMQSGRLPSLPRLLAQVPEEVHTVAATPTKSKEARGQHQVSEQSQPTTSTAPPPSASPGPSRQLGATVDAPQRSTSLDPEAMALVTACLAATLPKNDFLMAALTLAMVTAPSHVAKQMGGRTHCLTAWLHMEVRRVMSHKGAGELQRNRQLPGALTDAWDQLSTTPLLSFLPNGKAQLQLEQVSAATTEAAQGTGLPELSKRRWDVVHVQAHPYLHALQRLQAHSPGLFAVLTRCAATYVQSLVRGNSRSGPVGEGVAEIKAILLALL